MWALIHEGYREAWRLGSVWLARSCCIHTGHTTLQGTRSSVCRGGLFIKPKAQPSANTRACPRPASRRESCLHPLFHPSSLLALTYYLKKYIFSLILLLGDERSLGSMAKCLLVVEDGYEEAPACPYGVGIGEK